MNALILAAALCGQPYYHPPVYVHPPSYGYYYRSPMPIYHYPMYRLPMYYSPPVYYPRPMYYSQPMLFPRLNNLLFGPGYYYVR